MLGVSGGLFTDLVFMGVSFAVTSSGFNLAVVVLVAGFFAVVFFAAGFAFGFAVGLFVCFADVAVGFFVVFAMIGLLVYFKRNNCPFFFIRFIFMFIMMRLTIPNTVNRLQTVAAIMLPICTCSIVMVGCPCL
jgi:hypothetical protein